jgi:hypothetical protein
MFQTINITLRESKFKKKVARLKLELGLSEQSMLRFRRCQDLESQRLKRSLNLEECLNTLIDVYLSKYDPIHKALRNKNRKILERKIKSAIKTSSEFLSVSDRFDKESRTSSGTKSSGSLSVSDKGFQKIKTTWAKSSQRNISYYRQAIPASVKHQVQLRDQGQCTHQDEKGHRCTSRRHLEYHHIHPVAEGGEDSVENLKLLCYGHHRALHQK